MYSSVYVFSPSCAEGVGPAWDAWRRHIRKSGIPDEEQTTWDTWEPQMLEKLIERHKKVNAHLDAKKQKRRLAVLVLVDGFADAGDKVMHSSTNILTSPSYGGATWAVLAGTSLRN